MNEEGDMTLSAFKPRASAREAIKILKVKQPTILLHSLVTKAEGENEDKETILRPIQAVLDEYSDVFEEPKDLPPRQTYDHKI